MALGGQKQRAEARRLDAEPGKSLTVCVSRRVMLRFLRTEEGGSTMPGYKHPCRYCDKLLSADSHVCPFCGKVNPLGSLRCPRCSNPIPKGSVACGDCGLSLQVACPKCGQTTFFGDYCEHCDARLVVVCPKCNTEQPPIGEKCVKCGRLLTRVSGFGGKMPC